MIPEASPSHKLGSGTLQPHFGVQPLTAASRLTQVFGWEPRDFPAPEKNPNPKPTKQNTKPDTAPISFSRQLLLSFFLTYFFPLSTLYFNLHSLCSSQSQHRALQPPHPTSGWCSPHTQLRDKVNAIPPPPFLLQTGGSSTPKSTSPPLPCTAQTQTPPQGGNNPLRKSNPSTPPSSE